MVEIDYYEILQVAKNCDADDLKKAYRKLAMQYHPDKNSGDKEAEEMFKKINEAYQVLSDPEKRSVYDRYGKKGLEGGAGGFGNFNFDDIESIFESFFGGGSFSSGGKKKANDKYNLDMALQIQLEFSEAIFGCKREVAYSYKKPCPECEGSGAKGGKLEKCGECGGKGSVFFRQGFMTFSQTCPVCNGSGESVKDKCQSCKGSGFEEVSDTISVDIPAGIDNGNQIRLSNKGNVSKNGKRGDLYIVVSVKADERFIRDGDDIYLEVPIFFTQALLGETLSVPTPRDEVELKLYSGVADKQQFVYKSKGVPNVRTKQNGNFVAQVKMLYPDKLTEEQKELTEQLHHSFGFDSKPHESYFESILDTVKGWFK